MCWLFPNTDGVLSDIGQVIIPNSGIVLESFKRLSLYYQALGLGKHEYNVIYVFVELLIEKTCLCKLHVFYKTHFIRRLNLLVNKSNRGKCLGEIEEKKIEKNYIVTTRIVHTVN